jgi:hypothetical protein
VPGGYVKEFLRRLRLLVAKLMHRGSAGHTGPECRYNIGIAYLGEFMALLGKTLDIVLQELPLFLPTTLQIPGVVGLHVHTQEIAGKDLLKIFLAVDQVSGQVIKPGSGGVGQVDGEELNDEQVTICLACPPREAVVL